MAASLLWTSSSTTVLEGMKLLVPLSQYYKMTNSYFIIAWSQFIELSRVWGATNQEPWHRSWYFTHPSPSPERRGKLLGPGCFYSSLCFPSFLPSFLPSFMSFSFSVLICLFLFSSQYRKLIHRFRRNLVLDFTIKLAVRIYISSIPAQYNV